MIMSKAECKALNYLIHELISNNIQFEFINVFSDDSHLLQWISNEDPVKLVADIVETALTRECKILFGSLTAGNWTGGDSYFIGYKPIDS